MRLRRRPAGSGRRLVGMAERASVMGGTLKVVSSGAGTAASVVLPTA